MMAILSSRHLPRSTSYSSSLSSPSSQSSTSKSLRAFSPEVPMIPNHSLRPAIAKINSQTLASHPYAHMTFEVLNALFYFIGFVALATFLGKLLFCQGTVCHCARGADVFAAFSWILWTASSVLMGMDLFSDGFKSFKSAKTDEDARTAMKQEVKGPMRSTGIRLPERVHFQWRTQASGFAV